MSRRPGRRAWATATAISLAAVTCAGGARTAGATSTPAQTPAARGAFVSVQGQHLSLGGRPWTFLGYNLPCAQPFMLDPSQLQFVLRSVTVTSGANALRVWFFQQNGGPSNWEPFDRVIGAARAAGLRLVATLVNEWPTCEPATAATQPRKTLKWYQNGYRQNSDGYPLSFRDFAVQTAAHYANEPTIAAWQLVNEAEAATLEPNGQFSCDEQAAAHALRGFADDLATTMHSVDPNHPVSLGTIGGSQCGVRGADYAYVHGGAIGLCEYHDYGDPFSPLDSDQSDGLATRIRQCQALPGGGKPMFVGESGIVANVQPSGSTQPDYCNPWPGCTPVPVTSDSLNLRASLFRDKIKAAFDAGAAGYVVWFKGAVFGASNDGYAIGQNDPVEAAMATLSTTAGIRATAVPPPTGNATAPPLADDGSSGNNPLPLIALALTVGLVGTLLVRLTRRRRQARPGPSHR